MVASRLPQRRCATWAQVKSRAGNRSEGCRSYERAGPQGLPGQAGSPRRPRQPSEASHAFPRLATELPSSSTETPLRTLACVDNRFAFMCLSMLHASESTAIAHGRCLGIRLCTETRKHQQKPDRRAARASRPLFDCMIGFWRRSMAGGSGSSTDHCGLRLSGCLRREFS
jgi:hypothetical protein